MIGGGMIKGFLFNFVYLGWVEVAAENLNF